MVSLDPSSFFTTPLAFAGLALLIPVIILYLLRPKPVKIRFPSTMFIRFMEKNKRFTSFLQKFIRDPILFMQLLIITLLVLTLANPFTTSMEQPREDQSIVIVLDASASMQSTDVNPTRFDGAISSARKILGDLGGKDDVSLVLAESIPVTLLTKGDAKSADGILGKIKVSDTPTNIGDAVMLGKDILSGGTKKKTIYVLSDFMNAQGLDPQIARKIASVDGVSVSFVKVCGEEARNVGLVSVSVKRSLVDESKLVLTATVKNYASSNANVGLKFTSDNNVLKQETFSIKAESEQFAYHEINISNAEQVGKVEIATNDNLPVDDVAYVYIPQVRTYNVLLLTSDNEDKYLRLMLSSLKNIQVSIAVPPITPKFDGFDVIILGTVKKDSILPGTFRDIKSRIESGGIFVIVTSDDTAAFTDNDYWSMLPVYPAEIMNEETNIQVTQEHDMLSNVILENVVLKKYLKINGTLEGSKTLVGTLGEHPTPLISYLELGRGYVMYMGVSPTPEWSNFYYSSSFPILWSQMIKYFNKPRDSESMRDKLTGDYLQLPEEHNIQTPSGDNVKSQAMFLDKTGVYSINYDTRVDKIAVNLLNGIESNLTCVDLKDAVGSEDFSIERPDQEVKNEHYLKILALVLAFIVLEAIIYRRRGLL